jgi:hypothetical protein
MELLFADGVLLGLVTLPVEFKELTELLLVGALLAEAATTDDLF